MRLAAKAQQRAKREPTIALINIVFLMLVFFMVAGTLAQPLDSALILVSTDALEGRAPPDALVMRADGQLKYRGQDILDSADFMSKLEEAQRKIIRIVPDRNADAAELVRLGRELKDAGATQVIIVTEQGLR